MKNDLKGVVGGWGAGLALMGGLLAVGVGGCAGAQQRKDTTYARPFPGTMPIAETLNIQVFRGEKSLELTNTTGRAFGPSALWLNMRFNKPIESLAVGETLVIPLSDFRDEFGAAFRGGGFFAPERPDALALTQFETKNAAGESVLYGLVTLNGKPEEAY